MEKLIILTLCLVALASAYLDDACIDCMGKVERGSSGCNMDVGSLSCGKYQIKEPYWIDCGKPGGSWKGCAASDSCSRKCMKAYIARYSKLCAGHLGKPIGSLTCYDYGRIHNGGPSGCRYASTLSHYVPKMKLYC